MKEITLNLLAGEEVGIAAVGNYFRVLEGGADVTVKIPDLNISTVFKVGLGVQFETFSQVRLISEVNQKVVVAIASGRVDDSRLTGNIDTIQKGGSSYSLPAVVALVAGAAKEILAQDATRLKAGIQGDADIFIGSSSAVTAANGIKLAKDNLMSLDNTAALWAICVTSTNVRVISEYI